MYKNCSVLQKERLVKVYFFVKIVLLKQINLMQF